MTLLWSPHVFIGFFYLYDGSQVFIPYSKYLFFFCTLLSAILLLGRITRQHVAALPLPRAISILALMMITGVILSFDSIKDVQLLVVWALVTFSSTIGVMWAYRSKISRRFFMFCIAVAPFIVPVVLGLLLELLSLLEVPSSFTYPKHIPWDGHIDKGYPQRWQTMRSSPNGFGFDAAICMLGGLSLIYSQRRSYQLFGLLLLLAGGVAIFFSGTRAAMLMVVVGYSVLAVAYHSYKILFQAILVLGLGALAVLWVVGIDPIIGYLRLSGSVVELSSGRFHGFLEMSKMVYESPFSGLGFGAADREHPVIPSNLFYVSLATEIGLVGAAGAIGMLALPLVRLFKRCPIYFRQVEVTFDLLDRFCLMLLTGTLCWLLFEFDVFRISPTNQVVAFAWMWVLFMSNDCLKHNKNADR